MEDCDAGRVPWFLSRRFFRLGHYQGWGAICWSRCLSPRWWGRISVRDSSVNVSHQAPPLHLNKIRSKERVCLVLVFRWNLDPELRLMLSMCDRTRPCWRWVIRLACKHPRSTTGTALVHMIMIIEHCLKKWKSGKHVTVNKKEPATNWASSTVLPLDSVFSCVAERGLS